MNTHDKIDLPPMPRPQVPFVGADLDLMDVKKLALWCESTAMRYARAALAGPTTNEGQASAA